MGLEGTIALVTGAGSRGIGREIAMALAREGADVAIHAQDDPTVADQLAGEVRALGRRAQVLIADFVEPAAARGVVRETIARFGRIDVLVNNASTIVRKPVLELTDADFERLLAVNLRAYFACAQEAAADMVTRRFGRIIMVSSVNQTLVVQGQVAYCASKGGVMQLAKAMALELAPHNVTVNLIAPGTIETDINRHLLADPSFRELREGPIPMKRIGGPADIAAAAVFLAGRATGYMTGATLTVDGGLSLP